MTTHHRTVGRYGVVIEKIVDLLPPVVDSNEKTLQLVKPIDELEWRLSTGIREERPNIDKIIARTIDEFEAQLNGLFTRSTEEAQFTSNIIELYKALNPTVEGFEPNLTKPSNGRAKDAHP